MRAFVQPDPKEAVIADMPVTPQRTRTRWAIGSFLPIVLGGLIALAVFPVVVVGFLGTKDVSMRLLRDRGDLLVESVVTPIEDLLIPVTQQVEQAANLIAAGAVDPNNGPQFEAFVRGLMAPTPQVTTIAMTSPDGTLRHWSRDTRERLADDTGLQMRQSLLAEAKNGRGGHWSAPFISDVNRQIVLNYRTPIRRDGEVLGLLSAAVSTSSLSLSLDMIGKQFDVVPFVLANRTEIVAHPKIASVPFLRTVSTSDSLPTISNIGDPVMAAIWSSPREITGGDALRFAHAYWAKVNDVNYTYFYRNLPVPSDSGLVAGLYFASATTQRDRWTDDFVALVGLALMALAIFAATRLAGNLARPMTDFGEASRALGEFDFRERGLERWEKSRVDEVARTASAMRRMAQALSAFERYVPKSLVRQLLSLGNDSSLPAKREMSVMFLDLEGYTRFARGRSANEVADYLATVFSRIGPIIEECGGTIDKYTGDGLMAFWGAPLPDADHARHAVDAALRIAERLTGYIQRERELNPAGCRIRIGVHSGDVVVGDLGYGGRMNYTVVGDTVNMAKRTESAARGVAPDVAVIVAVTQTAVDMSGLSPGDHAMAHLPGTRAWLIGEGALAVAKESAGKNALAAEMQST